jgi:hypothetical protein
MHRPVRKRGKQKRQNVLADDLCSVSKRSRGNRYNADCHDQNKTRFQNLRVRLSARHCAEAVSDMYDADAGHCELERAKNAASLINPIDPSPKRFPSVKMNCERQTSSRP